MVERLSRKTFWEKVLSKTKTLKKRDRSRSGVQIPPEAFFNFDCLRRNMKIAMILLPLLVMACALTGSIEETVMDYYGKCQKGEQIELSNQQQTGIVKIKESRDFVFSGWENDTCTLRSLLGSCNYTKNEVENSSYSEFSEIILNRCFGK